MSVPILTLFNCKGGVGKTTLTANVAAMMGEQGYRVLVADLDPQYNLSAMFLSEDQLEGGYQQKQMVFDSLESFHEDGGAIKSPYLWNTGENTALLATDFRQSEFEESYASAWSLAKHDNEIAMDQLLGFRQLLDMAAEKFEADLILVDLGPQLSSMNRAILLHCTHMVVPLTANFLTIRTLELLGATLQRWQEEWSTIIGQPCCATESPPPAKIQATGYILGHIHQRGLRQTAAVRSIADQIPALYRKHILYEPSPDSVMLVEDEYCLAGIRNFHSLIQLSDDARKPIFDLQPADGAIGAHGHYVQQAFKDFKALSDKILSRMGLKR